MATVDVGLPDKRSPRDNLRQNRDQESSGYASSDDTPLVLKKPAGATFIKGDLNKTIYRDKPDEVNGWGKFYLPDIVSMQVVGVVEGTSCPCDQLVLMTCEDRKLYAYDGEELHEVASSMDTLLKNKEIEYPASTSYYYGEAFKDMTEEDWDEVRKSDVGKSLDEAHHKLVTELKPGLLKNLKIIDCPSEETRE